MNLSELRQLVRMRTRDNTAPYFFSDDEIDANLNEAQNEACIRASLIEDDESITIGITTTDIRYDIDPRVIDVIDITIGTVILREFTGWNLTEGKLILDSLPAADDTLTLHCYLLPASPMAGDSDEPEIRAVYHAPMVDWAISLCFQVPDADMYDKRAAERYDMKFTQHFGERSNALALRSRRSKISRCVSDNGYI